MRFSLEAKPPTSSAEIKYSRSRSLLRQLLSARLSFDPVTGEVIETRKQVNLDPSEKRPLLADHVGFRSRSHPMVPVETSYVIRIVSNSG